MTSNSELRQQLWEFVYELLPPEEEAALSERISSDPDVARAYSEVKLQTELVREAIRHDNSTLTLSKPVPAAPDFSPLASDHSSRIPPLFRQPFGNLLSAFLAASLLLVVAVAYSPLVPLTPLTKTTVSSPPRLTVMAPRTLRQGVTSPFTLQTRDLSDQPRSAAIDVLVSDSQNVEQWRQTVRTDSRGTAQFSVPAAFHVSANRLEFRVPEFEDVLAPLVTPLAARDSPLATYVSTDRRVYQPGDTVSFRTVTLPSLPTSPLPEVTVDFEIADQASKAIPGSQRQVRTIQGVGSGSFVLPAELAAGRYRLMARSPEFQFPPSALEIEVAPAHTVSLDLQLVFSRESYLPGDELIADVAVRRADGEPMHGAELSVRGEVDTQPLVFGMNPITTNADGYAQVRTQLPDQVPTGVGQLEFRFEQKPPEREEFPQDESPPEASREEQSPPTFAFALPIQVPEISIDWYPEGGHLIERVQNQVYFSALDRQGRPVELAGRLFNEQGELVVEVKTTQPGYGKFQLAPGAAEIFHVELDHPEGWSIDAPPLMTASEHSLTFRVRDSVIAAGEPVRLELYTHAPDRTVVASAYCRDVEVGRAVARTRGDGRPQYLEVPITAAAQGVVRLAVHDYSDEASVPSLLAERLVFCRPAQEWKFAFKEVSPLPDSPESRQFRILAENTASSPGTAGRPRADSFSAENDVERLGSPPPNQDREPAASDMSALGISLIDADESGRWGRELPRLPNFFQFLTRLELSSSLGETWLSTNLDELSVDEIDLLLGVHSGKQLDPPRGGGGSSRDSQFAANSSDFTSPTLELGDDVASEGIWAGAMVVPERIAGDRAPTLISPTIETAPRVYDNIGTIVAWQRGLEMERVEARQAFRSTLGRLLVALSILVLAVLTTTAVFRLARATYWIPSLAVAATCLILGSIWLGFQSPPAGNLAASRQLSDPTDSSPPKSPTSLPMRKSPDALLRTEPLREDLAASRDRVGIIEGFSADSLVESAELVESATRENAPMPGVAGTIPESRALGRQPAPGVDSMSLERRTDPDPSVRPEQGALALGGPRQSMPLRSHADADEQLNFAIQSGGVPSASSGLRRREPSRPRESLADGPSEPLAEKLEPPSLPEALDASESELRSDTLFRRVGSLGERERLREFRLSDLDIQKQRVPSFWNPLLVIHRSGQDESGEAPVIPFQPARTTKAVALIATVHGSDGLGELRDQVPLFEPISWELPVPSRLTLGDELELPLRVRNSNDFPMEVRIHLNLDPALRRITHSADQDDAVTGTSDTVLGNGSDLVISARLESQTVTEMNLPRIRAMRPGLAMVDLRVELPDRDLHEQWKLIILPGRPFQSRTESGWFEGNTKLIISLPGTIDEAEAQSTAGLLYLQWRGYPSLAAELHDAARVLTFQRVGARSGDRGATSADGSEVKTTPGLHRVSNGELESVDAASVMEESPNLFAEARDAVQSWLDQKAVSAPDVRRWSFQWSRVDPPGERQLTNASVGLGVTTFGPNPLRHDMTSAGLLAHTVGMDRLADRPEVDDPETAFVVDSDQWRQSRWLHGGWGSAAETARGLRALTADGSRPPLTERDCEVQILGPDGQEFARSMVPATSSRPLEVEGWWEVDRASLSALSGDGPLQLDIQLEGAERLPFVYHAAIYLPGEFPPSSATSGHGLQFIDPSGDPILRPQLNVGDRITLLARIESPPDQSAVMTWGLPAGLAIDREQLEDLVATGRVGTADLDQQQLTLTFPARSSTATDSEASVEGDVVAGEHEVDRQQLRQDSSQSAAVRLELTATMPGTYTGHPGWVKLEASPRSQQWLAPLRIEIHREPQHDRN